ncbi:MAG: methyltransferase domain-containing protein [Planctomycetia bacterium]|nr:methyltransferase domain-containing protein [Planctomycetia bacterium]NCG56010.1 methyltransferase domain-containing protein [Pseudomonadota bacterium]
MTRTPFVPRIDLQKRAARLARRGHPWLYRDDLRDGELSDPRFDTGTIVRLWDEEGHDLGLAIASTRSKIAIRLCGSWVGEDVPDPEAFLRQRIQRAADLRPKIQNAKEGCRLIHGEADLLPGLVVDKYADVMVMQATTAWMEAHSELVANLLMELFEPRSVLARNDVGVRKFERLPEEVVLLAGESVERVTIDEGGVKHLVRPYAGQKTGMYLDQSPARARVQELAQGARVLDLCCYQGGFSVSALVGGAKAVTAVDQSATALELAVETSELNGFDGLETIQGNVFDVVRELRSENLQFDLIVLDPPAFCKSRREVQGGVRGYRDLNRAALRLLAPGGRLITCSCSHHLKPDMFEDTLRQSALDLPFRVIVEDRLGAGADHPVLLRFPESEYLKVRVLRRWD